MPLLVKILIVMLIFLLIFGGIFIFLFKRFFQINPTIQLVAAPNILNNTVRVTNVSVIMKLPTANNAPSTITGRLYEHDLLTSDDKLQTFTINIPAGSKRGSTTFVLNVVNNGNEETLVGNTTDYSAAEDQWQIYVETDTFGRIQGAISNTVDLYWVGP